MRVRTSLTSLRKHKYLVWGTWKWQQHIYILGIYCSNPILGLKTIDTSRIYASIILSLFLNYIHQVDVLRSTVVYWCSQLVEPFPTPRHILSPCCSKWSNHSQRCNMFCYHVSVTVIDSILVTSCHLCSSIRQHAINVGLDLLSANHQLSRIQPPY